MKTIEIYYFEEGKAPILFKTVVSDKITIISTDGIIRVARQTQNIDNLFAGSSGYFCAIEKHG